MVPLANRSISGDKSGEWKRRRVMLKYLNFSFGVSLFTAARER
jgi:hypothetical protein